MLVALGLAGVDACYLDCPVGASAGIADLQSPLERFELTLDGRYPEVLDVELDARMDRIDLPGAGWQRCGAGGRCGRGGVGHWNSFSRFRWDAHASMEACAEEANCRSSRTVTDACAHNYPAECRQKTHTKVCHIVLAAPHRPPAH